MEQAHITVIRPKTRWLELGWKDVWQYRDLVLIFVRRDLIATYKQTVLGPLWFFISPILTTLVFSFAFGTVAQIGTQGLPRPVFYLSGLTLWNYFSGCFTGTSNTFVANANIFGKVYFPRLTVPVSLVISNMVKFFIQLGVLLVVTAYYTIKGDMHWTVNGQLLLVPFLVILMALLGLGAGILISSLTTKYRDVAILVTFGVGLLMFVTPVIYPLDQLPAGSRWFIEINPLTPIVEAFRTAMLGVGRINTQGLLYSSVCTLVLLTVGSLLFNKVEKSFMDTV